jgi:hypothetical protein
MCANGNDCGDCACPNLTRPAPTRVSRRLPAAGLSLRELRPISRGCIDLESRAVRIPPKDRAGQDLSGATTPNRALWEGNPAVGA